MAAPAADEETQRPASPAAQVGSPKAVNVLEQLPLLSGVLGGSRRVMRNAVQNATVLLSARVDPNLAAMDQAIPTWVIAKAKARARRQSVGLRAAACSDARARVGSSHAFWRVSAHAAARGARVAGARGRLLCCAERQRHARLLRQLATC